MLPELTSHNGLLASGSSSFLRKVRFSRQEFSADQLVSDIKYHHLGYQNDNLFHPCNNQLDYVLAKYFAVSETTNGNIDRFPSDPLIAQLTTKLSDRNTDKWI